MGDIAFENITTALFALVPGLVILYVRSHFLTAAPLRLKEQALSYLIVTATYWSILTLITGIWVVRISDTANIRFAAASVLGFTIIAPAIIGALLGVELKLGLLRKTLRRMRLNPVHVVPTAWDWKFTSMGEEFVLVTLRDGTKFRGWFDQDSFASSNPDERDLFINTVYTVREDIDSPEWLLQDGHSLWLRGDEIISIEFMPPMKPEGVLRNVEQKSTKAAVNALE